MKDITGREIQVGDKVILIKAYQGAIRPYEGEVIGFTPQKVKCKYIGTYRDGKEVTKEPHNLIVRV